MGNLGQRPPGTVDVTFFLSSPLCTPSAHSWFVLLSHPTCQKHWAHLVSRFLFLCTPTTGYQCLPLSTLLNCCCHLRLQRGLDPYNSCRTSLFFTPHDYWLLNFPCGGHGHYSPKNFDSVLAPWWYNDLPTLYFLSLKRNKPCSEVFD